MNIKGGNFKIKKEIYNIKKLILGRLNIIRYYLSKLEDTEIVISQVNNEKTRGLMKVNIVYNVSDNLKGFIIELFVNNSDPIEWIRIIIAHEMYHLLFAIDTVVKLDGYCVTDKSYSLTAIQRCIGNKIYGMQFEENLCWMLAYDTCKELNRDKAYRNDIYDKFVEFGEGYLTPIRNIIETFSIIKSADISKIKFDESVMSVPYNEFYYCMVGNISYIVLKFDEACGNGSWAELMVLVDEYYNTPEENEVIEKKIEEKLNKYKECEVRKIC